MVLQKVFKVSKVLKVPKGLKAAPTKSLSYKRFKCSS